MLWPEALPSAIDSHRMRAMIDGLPNVTFCIHGYNCFHSFGPTIKTELIMETRIPEVYISPPKSYWGNKTIWFRKHQLPLCFACDIDSLCQCTPIIVYLSSTCDVCSTKTSILHVTTPNKNISKILHCKARIIIFLAHFQRKVPSTKHLTCDVFLCCQWCKMKNETKW